jgi:uncharacterized protein YcbK (DUF882 family)
MGDLSPHFSRWEFDSHDGAQAAPTVALIVALERLRGMVGRPLRIVSGYRSVAHNKRVGGAPNSFHLRNMAADIPEGYATFSHAVYAGFSGIGTRGRWATHVDVRPGPLTHWVYR